MKKLLAATAASALFAGMAGAEEIKLGIIYGFTGPIESLTGSMAAASEAAIKEVSIRACSLMAPRFRAFAQTRPASTRRLRLRRLKSWSRLTVLSAFWAATARA